jgi:hypothetical protein
LGLGHGGGDFYLDSLRRAVHHSGGVLALTDAFDAALTSNVTRALSRCARLASAWSARGV